MGDIENGSEVNVINSKVGKQQDIFTTLRDLSLDPLKKAMEERIQRSIIENIENFSIIGKTNKEESKSHEDINGELEVIENHGGNIIYKMAKPP